MKTHYFSLFGKDRNLLSTKLGCNALRNDPIDTDLLLPKSKDCWYSILINSDEQRNKKLLNFPVSYFPH